MTGIPTRTEGPEDSGDPPARHARAWSARSSVLAVALAVLVVLGLAAAVAMLERQKPVTKNGACPFPDGISYCDMARGALGRHPYSYRPLVPLAARVTRAVTDLKLIASFRVVAIAGLLLTVARSPRWATYFRAERVRAVARRSRSRSRRRRSGSRLRSRCASR